MRAKLKRKWCEFKALPPGERFQTVHRGQADAPMGVKVAILGVAVICFAVGVLLSILPGPAFVFYGVAAGLLAVESRWVARLLDRAELALRAKADRFRSWLAERKRHHGRSKPKPSRSDAAAAQPRRS